MIVTNAVIMMMMIKSNLNPFRYPDVKIHGDWLSS